MLPPGRCRLETKPCSSGLATVAKTIGLVEARQHELTMTQRLGGGEAAVGGAEHALEELVARLVHVELLARDARDVHVDVLRHGAYGARIGAKLDHRQDRVADDVALAG